MIGRYIWILLSFSLLCESLSIETTTVDTNVSVSDYTTISTLLNSSMQDKAPGPISWRYINSSHNETLIKYFFKCVTSSRRRYRTLNWYKVERADEGIALKNNPSRSIILETGERDQKRETYRCHMINSQVVSRFNNYSDSHECITDKDCHNASQLCIMRCNRRHKCEHENFFRLGCLKKRRLGDKCFRNIQCETTTKFSECDKIYGTCRCKHKFKQLNMECRKINVVEEKLRKTVAAVGGVLFICIILLIFLVIRKKRMQARIQRNAQETLHVNCNCRWNDKPPSYEDILKEMDPPPSYAAIHICSISDSSESVQSIDNGTMNLQLQEQPNVASSSNSPSYSHHRCLKQQANEHHAESSVNSRPTETAVTQSEEPVKNSYDSNRPSSKRIDEVKSSTVYIMDKTSSAVQENNASISDDNILFSTYL